MGNQVLLCFGVCPGDWGARLCAPTLPDVGEWGIRFCCVLVFVQGIGAHVYAPLRLIGGMVVGFNRQFMIIAIADRMRGRTSMRPYRYPDQFSL
ncbi:hypothetical protein [Coleofasciculus sp. E1-EBD-02]|uniref:hypothetical protein n=1 Tax=Coleofasciculus sp. E1-EBD-02 TaxID=3068481 RepID=UPI0032F5BA94